MVDENFREKMGLGYASLLIPFRDCFFDGKGRFATWGSAPASHFVQMLPAIALAFNIERVIYFCWTLSYDSNGPRRRVDFRLISTCHRECETMRSGRVVIRIAVALGFVWILLSSICHAQPFADGDQVEVVIKNNNQRLTYIYRGETDSEYTFEISGTNLSSAVKKSSVASIKKVNAVADSTEDSSPDSTASTSNDSQNDLRKANQSCTSGLYGESINSIVSFLQKNPQVSTLSAQDKTLVLQTAKDAFTNLIGELGKKTAGATTQEQTTTIGSDVKNRIDQLNGKELRGLAQAENGFQRSLYLGSLIKIQSDIYFVTMNLIRGSSDPDNTKSQKIRTMYAELTNTASAFETEEGLKPIDNASFLRTRAAFMAYLNPTNNQMARADLQKAKAAAGGSPELMAQIDQIDKDIMAGTLRLVPQVTQSTPPTETGGGGGGDTSIFSSGDPQKIAERIWLDYLSPAWAWAQTNPTILILLGVVFLLWYIPVFINKRQIASGDIVASMYKNWVVRLGVIGYIVYLASRPKPERVAKDPSEKKEKKSLFGKQASKSKASNISCPFCKKPIDLIDDYESQKFDECPHCRSAIEPLFEPENYLQHLIEQLNVAAGKKKKKQGADMANSQVMSNLLTGMFKLAVHRRATDIHIERDEQGALVRFRVDGMLVDAMKMPASIGVAFLSSIKVQCDLDITNHMTPQDGRYQVDVDGTTFDIRVNCSPSHKGEILFMRLLDKQRILIKPKELGFEGNYLQAFVEAITKPHGLVLVTGPTGSGKSTTLYVALNQINTGERNILTIEDPVEYQLDGLKQMQVNPEKNFTFATGLRSILRQDPDVIMVGEIRDEETAAMAIDASVTGHLVFSTLHTMDTSSAISRLQDLNVSPKRYATALEVIIAQRLVRVICANCKQPHMPEDAILERLGILRYKHTIKFMAGTGCAICNFTSYYGRRAILEMLRPDEELRELMEKGSGPQVLREHARRKGMKLLREDGIMKVVAGQTTVDEVLRATDEIRKRVDTTNQAANAS